MKMSMFGPKMHPSCLLAAFLLEDCVSNSKLVICATLEQEAHKIITFIDAVPFKDQDIVIYRSVAHMSAQIRALL